MTRILPFLPLPFFSKCGATRSQKKKPELPAPFKPQAIITKLAMSLKKNGAMQEVLYHVGSSATSFIVWPA